MADRPRAVGINHVALEVSDVDAAVGFYRSLLRFELRGHHPGVAAWLDMGDQFLALTQVDEPHLDRHRHLGLVVDDKDAVRERLHDFDIEPLPGTGLDFLDPWGNRVQVVQYSEVQYSKPSQFVERMGFDGTKSASAVSELAEKGLS